MKSSQVNNSRGKIVPRLDLRVGTTIEERNFKDNERWLQTNLQIETIER